MCKRYRNVAGFFILLLAVCQPAGAESLRTTPQWLKQNLGQPDLVILDTRAQTDYEISHIAGAVNFPDDLTYEQKSKRGNIADPATMATLLRERGIDNTKRIIIYDAGQLVDAARVFWALEVYGLQKVKILSPGYEAWEKLGFPTSAQVPRVTPSDYLPTVDHRRIATKFTTQLATRNPHQLIIDARHPQAYKGKTSSARRFGHIPTAINIPVDSNLNTNNGEIALRNVTDLKALYADVPKDRKVIVYCAKGRVSATDYLAMRELGYDVANYDASWQEWGNDFNLPIEK